MPKKMCLKQGDRFGRLVLLGESESRNYKVYEKCKCDCGEIKWIPRFNLTKGLSKSCGCLRKELTISRNSTHGMGGSRFYKIYYGIKRRCDCVSDKLYHYYGLRGIKNLWNSFEDFKEDMYESYVEHCKEYGEKDTTIDRIDVNGNYCKENCRWATMKEQSNNKRDNIILTCKGKDYLSLKLLCEDMGLNYNRIKKRLEDGWDIVTAVETNKNGKYKKRGT